MRHRSGFIALLLMMIVLLLAGCGQVFAPPPTPSPVSGAASEATPTPDASSAGAAMAAKEQLAQVFGLSPDAVQVVSVEPTTWPDRCLGVTRMGVLCAKGSVAGYRVILAAQDMQWEYHTDATGSQIAPSQPVTTAETALAGGACGIGRCAQHRSGWRDHGE